MYTELIAEFDLFLLDLTVRCGNPRKGKILITKNSSN